MAFSACPHEGRESAFGTPAPAAAARAAVNAAVGSWSCSATWENDERQVHEMRDAGEKIGSWR